MFAERNMCCCQTHCGGREAGCVQEVSHSAHQPPREALPGNDHDAGRQTTVCAQSTEEMGQRLRCAYHIWGGGKVSLFHSHVGVVLKSGYVFPKLYNYHY